TRTEYGFKRAFATLFGQDLETLTGTMFLNMDQLEKQLDSEEFQEIGSMASFKVLETQFQMFIKSRIFLDDEYVVMTRNYFLQYTQLEISEFRDTLIQHMEFVKKSIDKRALHKREYDSWVNERQMQTTEEKVDTRLGNRSLDEEYDKKIKSIRPNYFPTHLRNKTTSLYPLVTVPFKHCRCSSPLTLIHLVSIQPSSLIYIFRLHHLQVTTPRDIPAASMRPSYLLLCIGTQKEAVGTDGQTLEQTKLS
nr:hypothetical protein [Tanacetum cinerariifolium]